MHCNSTTLSTAQDMMYRLDVGKPKKASMDWAK